MWIICSACVCPHQHQCPGRAAADPEGGGQLPKTGRARAAASRPGPAAPSLRVARTLPPGEANGPGLRMGAAERKWLIWQPQNRLQALKGLFPWALPGIPGHRSAALSVASGPPLCPQLPALGRGWLTWGAGVRLPWGPALRHSLRPLLRGGDAGVHGLRPLQVPFPRALPGWIHSSQEQ